MHGDNRLEQVRERAAASFAAILAERGCRPGRDGRAACPIHGGDNSTAFHVRNDGSWQCYTNPECGSGRDAVDFLVRVAGGTPGDREARTAVLYALASEYGIELPSRRSEAGAVHAKGNHIQRAVPVATKPADPFKPTKPLPDTSALNGGDAARLSEVREPRAVAVYPYQRASGEVVAYKVRVPHPTRGKAFTWHHADGRKSDGKHDPLPDDYRALVYRLPDLHAAAEAGETLVLVGEGEKVVDALRSIGLTATCHHGGGTAKWDDTHAQHLARFERAALFPDNDQTGRSHMMSCADARSHVSPNAHTCTVCVKNEWGAEGIGDVADFIAIARAKGWADERIRGTLLQRITDAFATESVANDVLQAAGETRSPLTLTCLADVQREDVAWLWPGYLPAGKVVLIDGDPGVGKSQLTMAIAAAVTTGAPFPGGSSRDPGDVLFLAMEDDAASTLRPRADAAGADVSRIMLHQGEGEARTPMQFPRDAARLRAMLATYPQAHAGRAVRLIVVDPIMSHVEDRQGHPDARTREALGPLVSIAQDFGVTVLAVRHFTKKTSGVAMNAGSGSVAYAALARVVLSLGRDPNDDTRRVLAMAKSNLGPIMPSVAFRIADANGVPFVQWDGTSPLSADDLLAARADSDDPDERSAREEAEDWIVEYLAAQPGHSCERAPLIKAAQAEGYAPRTTERALQRLRQHGRVNDPKRRGFGKGKTYTLADLSSPASSATPATFSDAGGTAGETGGSESGDLFGFDSSASSAATSPMVADVAELAGLVPVEGWDEADEPAGAA